MSDDMTLLEETADKAFSDWDRRPDAWQLVEESGLTRIGIVEELGGSGGDATTAAVVLQAAAYHSVNAPLAETMLLAGPMLAAVRLPLPPGPLTAAWADPGQASLVARNDGTWTLDGVLYRVPWARSATRIVVAVGERICTVDPRLCDITEGANLAGEQRDDVRLQSVLLEADDVVQRPTLMDLRLRGALARSIQITGAAQRAADLSVRYAAERVQFGRRIGAFQAVQQHLAQIAEEVAVAELATRSAIRVVTDGGDAVAAIAAARINACRAAGVVAELAHQVHGAIGTTEEHELHRSTLRLWSWREEVGNEHQWGRLLGERCHGAADPWVFLTGIDRAVVANRS